MIEIEFVGGAWDGERVKLREWPMGQEIEKGSHPEMTVTPEIKHVYRIEPRKSGGRDGVVLRHRKSYRPATEASER